MASQQPSMNAIIRKDVTQIPDGYAVTGFFDVQMTIENPPAPLVIDQKLPFQILVIQSQATGTTASGPTPAQPGTPTPGTAPTLSSPGLLTSAPVVSINNVIFDSESNTELAQLTLQGFISKDQAQLSTLSFIAASTSHQLNLTANGSHMTVTCASTASTSGQAGAAIGTLTVTGTGTATLDNQTVSQPGFTLKVHSGVTANTYDMVVTDGTKQIFTTNGEITPISPGLLQVFCPPSS